MNESPLDYESPLKFTRGQRCLLLIVPPLAAGLLKLILLTCRHDIRLHVMTKEVIAKGSFIGGFWHETVTLMAFAMRNTGFHTLTSYSFDGEMAAKIVQAFGMKALRGSSSRGGLRAIEQLISATEVIPALGFTLDGPRGPRREAKPGLAMLSARIQAPVYPFAMAISRSWRLKSWDRFVVPCPFSKVIYACGDPIAPPASLDRATIRAKTKEIQDTINQLTADLETELGQQPYWPPSSD